MQMEAATNHCSDFSQLAMAGCRQPHVVVSVNKQSNSLMNGPNTQMVHSIEKVNHGLPFVTTWALIYHAKALSQIAFGLM